MDLRGMLKGTEAKLEDRARKKAAVRSRRNFERQEVQPREFPFREKYLDAVESFRSSLLLFAHPCIGIDAYAKALGWARELYQVTEEILDSIGQVEERKVDIVDAYDSQRGELADTLESLLDTMPFVYLEDCADETLADQIARQFEQRATFVREQGYDLYQVLIQAA